MNPFVNPNKRDFLLPEGCKDLHDLLKLSKLPTTPATETKWTSNEGTLADAETHIRQFVESTGAARSLTIVSRQPDSSLTLFVAEPQILFHFLAQPGDQEAAVRRFFADRNLQPMHQQAASETALFPIPGATVYQIFYYLLPKDAKRVARITRELLQQVYGVLPHTQLSFAHEDGFVEGDQ